MNQVDRIIEQVKKERQFCIARREEKIEQRDTIAMAGWEGKVQGLNMALAILRATPTDHNPAGRREDGQG